MNNPFQPDQKQQKIIDLVPLLVELGRTANRSVMGKSQLPNPWDFGVLRQHWDNVVIGWQAEKVADLIKGLTYFESMFDSGFGSVPPAANLFRIYALMVETKDRDRLASWVIANTVNDYMPYGTNNLGARSLDELKKMEDARIARKQVTAEREQSRFEDARKQRSIQATAKLPNALRRMDSMAVTALIAKGADADSIGPSGKSARDIARELSVEAWLCREANNDH